MHEGFKYPCRQCNHQATSKGRFAQHMMKSKSFTVNTTINVKQHQKEILLNTKGQYMKVSSILVCIVGIRFTSYPNLTRHQSLNYYIFVRKCSSIASIIILLAIAFSSLSTWTSSVKLFLIKVFLIASSASSKLLAAAPVLFFVSSVFRIQWTH